MFSDQEISQLTAEIDAQLLELRSPSSEALLKSGGKEAQLVTHLTQIENPEI
jgi:hypothetical protein